MSFLAGWESDQAEEGEWAVGKGAWTVAAEVREIFEREEWPGRSFQSREAAVELRERKTRAQTGRSPKIAICRYTKSVFFLLIKSIYPLAHPVFGILVFWPKPWDFLHYLAFLAKILPIILENARKFFFQVRGMKSKKTKIALRFFFYFDGDVSDHIIT